MGVSPIRFKLLAFVIGTAMAGLGGALYAHLMRFISATDFGFTLSVSMMSMVVLGGIGTLWGPVLGALILGVLPEVFRPLIDYRMLLNAAILLLMIRFQPAGLLGEGSLLRRLFRPGRDSAHE
jgi:branched-chain amino acid transport system permease protein